MGPGTGPGLGLGRGPGPFLDLDEPHELTAVRISELWLRFFFVC